MKQLWLFLCVFAHRAAASGTQDVNVVNVVKVYLNSSVYSPDGGHLWPPPGSATIVSPVNGSVFFARSVIRVVLQFHLPGVTDAFSCAVMGAVTETPLWCGPLGEAADHFRFEKGSPVGVHHLRLQPMLLDAEEPQEWSRMVMMSDAAPITSSSFVVLEPGVECVLPHKAVVPTPAGVLPTPTGFHAASPDSGSTLSLTAVLRQWTREQLAVASTQAGLRPAPQADRRLCAVVDGRLTCWGVDAVSAAARCEGALCTITVRAVVPHSREGGSAHVGFILLDALGNIVAGSGLHPVLLMPPAAKPALEGTLFVSGYIHKREVDAVPALSPFWAPPSTQRLPHALPWWHHSVVQSHEWSVFSQNGEDGVLWYLLSVVGATSRTFVEFGVESGKECNTRLLQEHLRWTGLLMDPGPAQAAINLHTHFVTPGNVNQLFLAHGVPREFDVLSIDIDFFDFWVWRALDDAAFRPRVVVIEVNSHIPPTDARVVCCQGPSPSTHPQYRPGCEWDGTTNFFGGSLLAFWHLAAAKGYTLLYCETRGVNCFFVRNDVWRAAAVRLGDDPTSPPELFDVYRPTNFHGLGYTYPDADLDALAAKGLRWGTYTGEPWSPDTCHSVL